MVEVLDELVHVHTIVPAELVYVLMLFQSRRSVLVVRSAISVVRRHNAWSRITRSPQR
jgi:hypothetical protein